MVTDQPQTQGEYDQIVTDLADEFAGEIDDGVSRNIARHLVAGMKVHNGRPIVQQSAEYEGGAVEAIDRTLYPMVVLRFTRTDSLSDPPEAGPQIWRRATTALAHDLRVAYQKAGDTVDEAEESPV